MALSPTIPTSFVPRPSTPRRFRADFGSAFSFLAYTVLGAVFLLAVGVFLYGRILAVDKASKDKELAAAVAAIDSKAAKDFRRLYDRLNLSGSLLNGHVAFSGFLSLLEKVMPATVRLTSLHVVLDASGVEKGEAAAAAKCFTALAAASSAFAEDGRIKDAIFSSIKISRDNSVSFLLAATLDPSVITFSP